MTMFRFTDAVMLDGSVNVTDRGLVAVAKAARTGIQDYLGSEVGRPDLPVVRVYRPADEVFSADALASFSHAPITMDHPPEMVTPENWDNYAVGEVSTAAGVDKKWVSLPLIVKAKNAIDAVQGGKNQLSAGYSCKLDWTPGVDETGQAFDAVQRNIVINHVAIVDAARAGNEARIGDEKRVWGASPMQPATGQPGDAPITQTDNKEQPMSNVTIVLGDKAVQVAATDAPAVEAFKADTAKKFDEAVAAHDKAIAAKDAELAAKDAEIDALKGKVLEGAALDAAVAARGDLIATAKIIAPNVKTDGVADADIRKAVVIDRRGDSVKDKSQAYFDAAFDILAEDADTVDPVRNHIIQTPIGDKSNDAHANYLSRMTDRKEA